MNDKRCSEFEKSGWTLNPATGRKISPTGRVAKKLRESCGFTNTPEKRKRAPPTPAQCREFASKPGINPLTKRTISLGGPTHRMLTRTCGISAPSSRKTSRSVVRLEARACSDKGFMQHASSTTCWFNSVLNALLMGDSTGRVIRGKIEKLPKNVLTSFEKSADRAACPSKPDKTHVLKYAYRYYRGLDGLMSPTGRDRPWSAIRGVMETPDRLSAEKSKNGGFFPQRATAPILGAFLNREEFAITSWKDVNHAATDKTKIISFQIPKRDGKYFELRGALRKRTKPKTLAAGKIRFELSSAVLTLTFADGLGHAVAVYRCGGVDYMYDSNLRRAARLPWSDGIPASSEKKLRAFYEKRHGRIVDYTITCEFFARVGSSGYRSGA